MEKTNQETFKFEIDKGITIIASWEVTNISEEEEKEQTPQFVKVTLTSTNNDIILHWGLAKNSKSWTAPDKENYPSGTKSFDNKAVQTKFIEEEDVARIVINIPSNYSGINFVVYDPANVETLLTFRINGTTMTGKTFILK